MSSPPTDPASDHSQRTLRIRLVPYTPNFATSTHMPHHTLSPSLRFPPVERQLPPRIVLKIGRFTDRHHSQRSVRPPLQEDIRFRSKVVSRHHAELWLGEDGSVYIRDTASSSGTFLNNTRLSPQSVASGPVKLKDGDTLQLGVEYRGGEEEVYRCVRMRIELGRPNDQCGTYRHLLFITNG